MRDRPVIEVHSGDIALLTFEVVDEDGVAVNLSTATDIDVQLFAIGVGGVPTGAAVLAENLAGDVDLVGGGTAGKCSLALAAADTAALAGDYWIEVRVEDAAGLFRTATPCTLRVLGDLITS